jgi:malonate-semialdehyde dehydrogenase (acetylating)/methylmalonate-semialdehyde dehydrogenase
MLWKATAGRIEQSLAEGAKMVLDGRAPRVEKYPDGFFLGPTILEDVNVDMAMAKQEAFGPVAALIRGDSLDQAIEWINTKTNLGHSACILTSSGSNARKFTRAVNVGNVGINVGVSAALCILPAGLQKGIVCGNSKIKDGLNAVVYG